MKYNFEEMILRIKVQKKSLGLTNEELSISSGIPFGTLNKVLGSETKEPRLDTILKLADALNVSANFLIYGRANTDHHPFASFATTRITEKLPRLTEEQLEKVEARIDTYIEDNESDVSKKPVYILETAAKGGGLRHTELTEQDIAAALKSQRALDE